jgi:hypothetical protein
MPEVAQAHKLQQQGKHAAAHEAIQRVVDTVGAVPDAAFQQVGLELQCHAALLSGGLPRIQSAAAKYTRLCDALDVSARPRAFLRARNLSALLLLRAGAHADALDLLQSAAERVDSASVDARVRVDASYAVLRQLLTVQLAAAAMTRKVFSHCAALDELAAASAVAGSSSCSPHPHEGARNDDGEAAKAKHSLGMMNVVGAALATVRQLAVLHADRAALAAAAATAASSSASTAAVPAPAPRHLVGARAHIVACTALPLGSALQAIHHLHLGEAHALQGGGSSLSQTRDAFKLAVDFGELSPGLPYAAAAPLRALARLFEGSDFSTAEALHTANADNMAAWHALDPKRGTWQQLTAAAAATTMATTTNSPSPSTTAAGHPRPLVSATSVAEEYLRSVRARAGLVGRLEWNGKKRDREAHALLAELDSILARFPELKAAASAAAALDTTDGKDRSGGSDSVPGSRRSEVADVSVLPSWHFDICRSVLFD